jgi:hypothetical protein
MIFASAPLVISASLSSTKKRTLFSRLPLSEPTISYYLVGDGSKLGGEGELSWVGLEAYCRK